MNLIVLSCKMYLVFELDNTPTKTIKTISDVIATTFELIKSWEYL